MTEHDRLQAHMLDHVVEAMLRDIQQPNVHDEPDQLSALYPFDGVPADTGGGLGSQLRASVASEASMAMIVRAVNAAHEALGKASIALGMISHYADGEDWHGRDSESQGPLDVSEAEQARVRKILPGVCSVIQRAGEDIALACVRIREGARCRG